MGCGSRIKVELNGGDDKMGIGEFTPWLLPVCLCLSGSPLGLRIKVSSYFYFIDCEILEYI